MRKESKMSYRVGDRIVIVGNDGNYHHWLVGEFAKIVEVFYDKDYIRAKALFEVEDEWYEEQYLREKDFEIVRSKPAKNLEWV